MRLPHVLLFRAKVHEPEMVMEAPLSVWIGTEHSGITLTIHWNVSNHFPPGSKSLAQLLRSEIYRDILIKLPVHFSGGLLSWHIIGSGL